MKTNAIFTTFLVFFLSFSVWAQSQGFNYKAILSENGNILQNQAVTMRFTIYENGTTQVYQETHATTTDENGIVVANIGEGNTSDNFSAIDWSNSQYLNVAFDTGSGYVDMGTTEFKAVPYAKYASKAETADYINHSFWHQISNGISSDYPIGIGIPANLEANLHIKDVMSGLPLLQMESTDNIYTIWKSNRAGADDYLIGIDGGNNRFLFANTTTGAHPLTLKEDKIGINNLNPTANLDVNGSFKLTDGTEGNGKVLTSDPNGNASWVTDQKTYTIMYSPLAIKRFRNDKNFVRNIKEFYFSEGTGESIYLPLNLPDGATITEITYYYYDNATANLSFSLGFSRVSTGSNQSFYLTQANSSGQSTSVQSKTVSINLGLDSDYNYGFRIYTSDGVWPGDNSLSIRGIKVTYIK